MVVDDADLLAAHIDEEVHAHVARGVVGDGVVAQDGVARGQKQAVAGLRGFGDEGGIGVFVSQQLQGRETVALIRGLLQTDEVGVAIEQVAHHLALLSFLRDVALKHGHVP